MIMLNDFRPDAVSAQERVAGRFRRPLNSVSRPTSRRSRAAFCRPTSAVRSCERIDRLNRGQHHLGATDIRDFHAGQPPGLKRPKAALVHTSFVKDQSPLRGRNFVIGMRHAF